MKIRFGKNDVIDTKELAALVDGGNEQEPAEGGEGGNEQEPAEGGEEQDPA